MTAGVVRADALTLPIADESVDLIVTSPPYFALRSYQDGGEHYDGQIGSEHTPQDFLRALWAVTAECWRVLKPSGSLFVNLGDKYAGVNPASYRRHTQPFGPNGTTATGYHAEAAASERAANHRPQWGVRSKSLMGLPWRYAIGCVDGEADPDGIGWILRAEIVWSKPNGLPESVTDRVRRSHEQWFHLTKSPRYYTAIDELREPHADQSDHAATRHERRNDLRALDKGAHNLTTPNNPLGKLPGSVWEVPSEPLVVPDHIGVDHFAAFPTEWPRRLILGWSPSGICTACGEGRCPVADKTYLSTGSGYDGANAAVEGRHRLTKRAGDGERVTITSYACACEDDSAPTREAVVLDPFGGTGTVAMVANALGRTGISVDLSADYCRLAQWRIHESNHDLKAIARTQGEHVARSVEERRAAVAAGQAALFED